MGIDKNPGHGLPGGGGGLINGISTSVKVLIFSERGLLIVSEKVFEKNSKSERYKESMSYEEAVGRITKRASSNKIESKILGNFFYKFNASIKNCKILLTAIRETVEETGLLINPRILKFFPVDRRNKHQSIICLGEIVAGKMKKESEETFNSWIPLEDLPYASNDLRAENFPLAASMYASHKKKFLRDGLEILLKENYKFPFPEEEVINFLKEKTPSL
ncbi:NUDIX domain-containing protein [Patescibacteria group bacterium]|nr:NUDIX domain-containing protein [Patescibacteria group bacterium]